MKHMPAILFIIFLTYIFAICETILYSLLMRNQCVNQTFYLPISIILVTVCDLLYIFISSKSLIFLILKFNITLKSDEMEQFGQQHFF